MKDPRDKGMDKYKPHEPQEDMIDSRKKIDVAYFWDPKDDSKIIQIMTKKQILYPAEKTTKMVKGLIRKIKKLGGVPFHPALSEYISRAEVLKIVSGGDIDANTQSKKSVHVPKRSVHK